MKALVVLLTILAGVWLVKRSLRRHAQARQPSHTTIKTLPMVGCQHCGMHIPGHEAVIGRAGSYCCLAHQRAHEGKAIR